MEDSKELDEGHQSGSETSLKEDGSYINQNEWPIVKNSTPLVHRTRIFYGNQHLYLLLRYHNILCQRLLYIYNYSEKLILTEAEESRKGKTSVAQSLNLHQKREFGVQDYYVAFLDQVKKLLDLRIDQTQYEDNLREIG